MKSIVLHIYSDIENTDQYLRLLLFDFPTKSYFFEDEFIQKIIKSSPLLPAHSNILSLLLSIDYEQESLISKSIHCCNSVSEISLIFSALNTTLSKYRNSFQIEYSFSQRLFDLANFPPPHQYPSILEISTKIMANFFRNRSSSHPLYQRNINNWSLIFQKSDHSLSLISFPTFLLAFLKKLHRSSSTPFFVSAVTELSPSIVTATSILTKMHRKSRILLNLAKSSNESLSEINSFVFRLRNLASDYIHLLLTKSLAHQTTTHLLPLLFCCHLDASLPHIIQYYSHQLTKNDNQSHPSTSLLLLALKLSISNIKASIYSPPLIYSLPPQTIAPLALDYKLLRLVSSFAEWNRSGNQILLSCLHPPPKFEIHPNSNNDDTTSSPPPLPPLNNRLLHHELLLLGTRMATNYKINLYTATHSSPPTACCSTSSILLDCLCPNLSIALTHSQSIAVRHWAALLTHLLTLSPSPQFHL
ncbi:hypothetical protein AYI68_g2734 [Smittium mucronatum]|uniref:Uncharacterized protein n=1 Tax=Smittium mucronatum TaxID=133383 RepID=A0A1R0H1X9_9FUNG|nr:hypothetical protein AYI68_g2734 [Smittium mucronatum]